MFVGELEILVDNFKVLGGGFECANSGSEASQGVFEGQADDARWWLANWNLVTIACISAADIGSFGSGSGSVIEFLPIACKSLVAYRLRIREDDVNGILCMGGT